MRPKIIIFILCCFSFSRQYAQSDEYVFSHLDFANGLSSNHVTCFYKDPQGFMWFGTTAGLNRYDGYEFRVFKHDPRDSNSIADNYIEQVFAGPDGKMWIASRGGKFNIYDFTRDRFDQDYGAYLRKLSLPEYLLLGIARSKDGFWFVYQNSGLFHYLNNGKIISLTHNVNDPYSIDASGIASAEEDSEGYLWIIHQNGILEKVDSRLNIVIYRSAILEKEFNSKTVDCSIFIDRQNDLWIYSNGELKGVYYYHPATNEIKHLSQDAGEGRLNSNVIYNALQDGKGLIWLGTDHAGVDIVDKKDFSVKLVGHIEDDPKSLAENSIPSMYRDYTGAIWLGSYKNGISYIHQDLIQFPEYRHQPFNPASLSYDDVNSFVEDPAGNIWIGSDGGGLIYFDRKKNTFRQFLHNTLNSNSLCNNIIVTMLMDKENKLWIGTYFGGLDCYDGQTFTHYRHHDDQPASLADDRVMSIYEDSNRNLWIGTLSGGLDRLDRKKNSFYHYTNAQPNSLLNNYVSAIL
jgi:ligand-binding sensor domain-containing protein